MKSTPAVILAFCFSSLISVTASAADTKNEALTECKDHLNELYQDGLRTKVKRIKKRKGEFEVKMKVSAEGERFNAVCSFADGNMTYSTDRANNIAKVSKQQR